MGYVLVVIFAIGTIENPGLTVQPGGRYRDETECKFAAEVMAKLMSERTPNGARAVCLPLAVGKPA